MSKGLRIPGLAAGAGIVLLASGLVVHSADGDYYWPQWRGPEANGVARNADPPIEWSETRNVSWKVEIPGRGSGSPVIWDDRIYLLTAIPEGVTGEAAHAPRGGEPQRGVHQFAVLAIDRRDGSVVWQRVAREEEPHEAAHHLNATWASGSAVTDGERVFAFFESRGLYAYDRDGRLLWQTDLGDKYMRDQFGDGTTPVLHGNYLVLLWDHQQDSFIVAFDKRTGEELWRTERDEITSWATPLIVEHEGRAQIVTSGANRLRSYDLETGRLIWESEGVTESPIPSPVAGEGMVVVTSGGRSGNRLQAIRLAGAEGDISGTGAIAWTLDRDTPHVPSPLLYDGILYLLKGNTGILSAFDIRGGRPHYQLQRLDEISEAFSSPVGAVGRVYVTSRDGTTLVLRHGPTFEVLARNTLDDGFDASPALVDREIYLRGNRYLYRIEAE